MKQAISNQDKQMTETKTIKQKVKKEAVSKSKTEVNEIVKKIKKQYLNEQKNKKN